MILESIQMLCTAIRMCDGTWHKMQHPDTGRFRKFNTLPGEALSFSTELNKWTYSIKRPEYLCHSENHPCNIWARQTLGNWIWLKDLTIALNVEKRFRYGDYDHKSIATLSQIEPPKNIDQSMQVTLHPCAMPDDCRISENPITNYRKYYCSRKTHLAKWSLRGTPDWFHPEPV